MVLLVGFLDVLESLTKMKHHIFLLLALSLLVQGMISQGVLVGSVDLSPLFYVFTTSLLTGCFSFRVVRSLLHGDLLLKEHSIAQAWVQLLG